MILNQRQAIRGDGLTQLTFRFFGVSSRSTRTASRRLPSAWRAQGGCTSPSFATIALSTCAMRGIGGDAGTEVAGFPVSNQSRLDPDAVAILTKASARG